MPRLKELIDKVRDHAVNNNGEKLTLGGAIHDLSHPEMNVKFDSSILYVLAFAVFIFFFTRKKNKKRGFGF